MSKRLMSMLSSLARRAGRFGRDQRGAAAIEFAVLAIPFFMIIYAILETALVFLGGQILESAVNDASRKVRTGLAAGWSVAEFRQEVCNGLYGLFDCSEDGPLRIIVNPVSSFSSATLSNPINPECKETGLPEDCNYTVEDAFDGGQGSGVVLVQAYYKWPVILTLPGIAQETQAGNTRLLSAILVFKNEPFG